ncbi:MAG TPA: hypothetical protein PLI27_03975 [Ignavibacteriales bacterium]|nr:hypothetical protein [Ignavibacteriales bacterium]HOL81853.1 hypothetical protein [Ignavibacteriales bacterium]HOM65046.1 hypothetical protein [Ignavibacteriales bacterium]HPD67222.1 hypothetical protein [Ignavibacteriales bacterium]HPP34010.1 hypothetical protein [Ignavibacteriales bacterium]
MENEKKILEYFENLKKEVRPGDVAEATGLDKKEVEKIIKKLVKEEKIYSPKRCFYKIK